MSDTEQRILERKWHAGDGEAGLKLMLIRGEKISEPYRVVRYATSQHDICMWKCWPDGEWSTTGKSRPSTRWSAIRIRELRKDIAYIAWHLESEWTINELISEEYEGEA